MENFFPHTCGGRLQEANEAMSHLRRSAGESAADPSAWVFYGSFVLDALGPLSDIDSIRLIDTPNFAPRRSGGTYLGFPTTTYSLTRRDLLADGKERKFGGYFAIKLMSPHIVLPMSATIQVQILKTIGGFIAPFAAAQAMQARGKPLASRHEMTADCLRAVLALCPWYAAYLARYTYAHNSSKIWEELSDLFVSALTQAGASETLSPGQFQYMTQWEPDHLHRESVQSIARFWAAGACLHNNEIGFPDRYIGSAKRYLSEHKDASARVRHFIQSGGEHDVA